MTQIFIFFCKGVGGAKATGVLNSQRDKTTRHALDGWIDRTYIFLISNTPRKVSLLRLQSFCNVPAIGLFYIIGWFFLVVVVVSDTGYVTVVIL